MGRRINQIRGLCLPTTQLLGSKENQEPTYSSVKLLSTNKDHDALNELPDGADERRRFR